MSEVVDTEFTPEERDELLTEVREHLPAFLVASATQQHDPVGDVTELLRLERGDLQRVTAVHICLSTPVRQFIGGLRPGIRRPITSSTRPRIVTQAVRGPIDWGATIRTRAALGGDRTAFVVRPARRIFNTPENRALVWLLGQLDKYLWRAAPGEAAEYDREQASWSAELRRQRNELLLAGRYRWLQEVPSERPTRATLRRLRAARSAFYARLLPDAIRHVERLGADPTEEDLTELLCQRYFRPEENWRLFEVVVALRLARAFAESSPEKRKARLLVGVGGDPYARYVLPDGDEIRLVYQAWPPDSPPSLYAAVRDAHHLRAGEPRPDLIIQRDGAQPDAVVLELKATRSGSTLGSGLSQLLGYLKERPGLWHKQPSGWLVAPRSDAYRAAAAELDAWVVDADQVADAAVERFLT